MAGDGLRRGNDTTRRLLIYRFLAAHRRHGGRRFEYHYGGTRYAVETLIWLYEVAKVRRQKDLIESFADRQGLEVAPVRRLPARSRENGDGQRQN